MCCGKTRAAVALARSQSMTKSGTDTRNAVAAGSAVTHEVLRNGISTGRKFTSIISAQAYANRVGGTIRTNSRNG